MREKLLTTLYTLFPFDLKGDCVVPAAGDNIRISCVINFYGRLDLLTGILHSLAQQNLPRELFEVILVEDRGGTIDGRTTAEEFSNSLQVVYTPLDKNFGKMGYSRNYGLSLSRGEFILFLDDDTVILQKNFLCLLLDAFEKNKDADAVVPHGSASYALIKGRYDFHDPYFMTSRCTAYRRGVLAELGGFMGHFVGQEDVEFVIRFLMAGRSYVGIPKLEYYHPPLLLNNLNKPRAVGGSFYTARKRYPFWVWLMIVVNCGRHFPLILSPLRRHREMGRFGIGFMLGMLSGLLGTSDLKYS